MVWKLSQKYPGVAWKVLWSFNGYRGWDHKAYDIWRRKHPSSFSFFEEFGFGHEWWNFYEGFSDEYYYGYAPSPQGMPKNLIKDSIIFFISRPLISKETKSWYLVGIYGKAEILDEPPHNISNFQDYISEDRIEDLEDITKAGLKERIGLRLRGDKRFSTPMPQPVRVNLEEDLGAKNLGQASFKYLDWKRTSRLLKKAITAVEELEEKAGKGEYFIEPSEALRRLRRLMQHFNTVLLQTNQQIRESSALASIRLKDYLASTGYMFEEWQVSQAYTALKTKGFVILSGLSGTGKTKLAIELARLLVNENSKYLLVPVHPDWRDSKPLIGYYNPLTERYHKPRVLELVLMATKEYKEMGKEASPYFLIFDEMNLAHVEYYFADFISILESGRAERDDGGIIKGCTRETLKLHNIDDLKDPPKEICLPPNLYVIGTVNIDETTYMFSPKVLDRAFTIEFHDVDLENYPPEGSINDISDEDAKVFLHRLFQDFTRYGKFLFYSREEITNCLNRFKNSNDGKYWKQLRLLEHMLKPYDLHFGYRVVNEIALYYCNALDSVENGVVSFSGKDEIFDTALLMKILPKFYGSRSRLEKPLLLILKLALTGDVNSDDSEKTSEDLRRELLDEEIGRSGPEAVASLLRKLLTGDTKAEYTHTTKKVLRMLRELYEVGFASFG